MAQTLTQIGKYRIENELGRGAMGVVYKAFDPVVERRVAIKTIRLDVEDASDLLNRLKREAKSVGQLEHQNIVTLYDAGESSGLFYLAMQFIEGETLQDRIERQRWFTTQETLEIFSQVCSGLDYAHSRGVIHRDIKPANIMITSGGIVKLTDFGIAKLTGAGTSTSGLIVGTPSYMSPEQAVGKQLDGRSDIFSLGSILYEMLTGEKAFPGQNVTTVIYKIVHESPTPVLALQPGLDAAVEPIVLKALAKNPAARFQTCSELAAALEAYVRQPLPRPLYTVTTAGADESRPVSLQPSVGDAGPQRSGTIPALAQSERLAAAAPSPLGTQATPPRGGMPLAWVGGGVVGTLLLVIVILLVVQMRKPAQSNLPSQSTSAQGSQSRSQVNPTQGAPTQPAGGDQPSTAKGADAPPTKPEVKPDAKPVRKKEDSRRKTPPTGSVVTSTGPQEQTTNKPSVTSTSQPDQPETFSSLLLKGDLAFQQSHYEEALAAYKKAYLLNNSNAEVKRKIGVVLTLLGRPEEASRYR